MLLRRVRRLFLLVIILFCSRFAFSAPALNVCARIKSADDIASLRKTALQSVTTEATFCQDCSGTDTSSEVIANMVKPKNPAARKFLACLTGQLSKQQHSATRENEFLLDKLSTLGIDSLPADKIASFIQHLDAKDPRKSELLKALTGVDAGTRTQVYAIALNQTYDPKKPLPGTEILADFQDAVRGNEKRSEYHPDSQQAALTPWVAKQILIELVLEKISSPAAKAKFLANFKLQTAPEKNNQNILQTCLSSALNSPLPSLSPQDFLASTGATVPLQKKLKPSATTCEFEWSPGDLVTTAEHTFVVLGYSTRKDGGVELNTLEVPGRNMREFNVVQRTLCANTNPTCTTLNLDEHAMDSHPPPPSRAVVWNWQN